MTQTASFVRNLAFAISLLRRSSPHAFHFAIGANVATGLIPVAVVYFGARLIEQLTQGHTLAAVAALIVGYVVLCAFQDSLDAISSFVLDTLSDAVRITVKGEVNRAVSTFPDLSIHEDADLRETAVLSASAGERIAELVMRLYAVSVGIVIVIPVTILTARIAWWVPVLMLLAMAPATLLRAKAERASWDVCEHHASTFNELRLLERVLTQPDYAKDLRTYAMQDWLLHRWHWRYRGYFSAAKMVRVRNAGKLAAASLFASACLGVSLAVIADGFSASRFNVGDLAIFLGALVQLRDGLRAIVYNFGDTLAVTYAVHPYRRLLEAHAAHRRERRCEAPKQPDATQPPTAQLSLDSVTLEYRGAATPALIGIDLTVRAGETIAVVGDNGAGKSSLMKLLCGLYEPSSGSLTWEGASHRVPRIVAVFQDFARFPLTPRENLVLPDRDDSRAAASLQAVGLNALLSGLDKPLTTEMEDGSDLSGGQWQRLAIARAVAHAHDADLLVFDEPTSALDPESEARIMSLLLETAAGKTAFIVSHRLALTRFVDRIIVLDRGRIVEDGSHHTLMQANGKYARMFRAQAAFYH
ncbi:hypothetical protein C9I57_10230 [Trinickia symbiotica]|uniref:ABC transporter domain-containing protein n=1 Tax=Trinickia symbiotica TaxID=863227 RepID=A0A2T3XX42_9BURK|nr:ABC transporter ATP-binding protein [Trinickia symbiotica]PTB21080.1 hypothetical protein C9I57_10230 [Trinickia symbiotica]